jgi:predicted DNA-binding transcriptional regulator AlpA
MKVDSQTAVEKLLDAQEVCAALSCSKVSLHRRMKRGGFPHPLRFDPSNPRSRLRFRASEIATWIAEQQARTIAAENRSERHGIHGAATAAGTCATE